MIGVIIAANDRDKKMRRILPEILCQNFQAVFLNWIQNGESLDNKELVICGSENARWFCPDKAILICKDAEYFPEEFFTEYQSVAVVDSCNGKALGLVGATGLPAITCGLSVRDTFTLSSFDVDSAVLSLQRSITCFDGTVAEPQEIPLKLGKAIDSFTLMAAAAVFVLTGNAAKLKNALF